jgi:hypothetical protein
VKRTAFGLVSAGLAAFCALTTASRDAAAIEPRTRDEIISMSKDAMGFSYWWGHGRFSTSTTVAKGSCSGNCGNCTHSGSYGGDCSGLAAKVWQIPGPTAFDDDEHPYATTHFRNNTTHWQPISRASAKRGDAFTYNVNGAGHIFIYESDDQAGKVVAYECIGCSYGCQHRTRSYSDKPYIVIRRDDITETTDPVPPPEPPPPSSTPTLAAKFVGQGSSLGAPDKGIYYWNTCTSEAFSFWFELSNTSDVAWTDTSGTAWGSAVRLGALDDVAGPLTPAVTRVSVGATANTSVSPTGGDCNDADGCKRVRFDLEATAPSTPGLVRTSWRLVDEGRGWFGPELYLDFNVQDCGTTPPDPPGTGGTGGTSAGTGGSGSSNGKGGSSSGTGGSSNGQGGTGGANGDPPPDQPVDPGFDPVEDGDSDTTPPPAEGPTPSEDPPVEATAGAGGKAGSSSSGSGNRRLSVKDDTSSSEGACTIGAGTPAKRSPGLLGLGLVAALGAALARRKRLGPASRASTGRLLCSDSSSAPRSRQESELASPRCVASVSPCSSASPRSPSPAAKAASHRRPQTSRRAPAPARPPLALHAKTRAGAARSAKMAMACRRRKKGSPLRPPSRPRAWGCKAASTRSKPPNTRPPNES